MQSIIIPVPDPLITTIDKQKTNAKIKLFITLFHFYSVEELSSNCEFTNIKEQIMKRLFLLISLEEWGFLFYS